MDTIANHTTLGNSFDVDNKKARRTVARWIFLLNISTCFNCWQHFCVHVMMKKRIFVVVNIFIYHSPLSVLHFSVLLFETRWGNTYRWQSLWRTKLLLDHPPFFQDTSFARPILTSELHSQRRLPSEALHNAQTETYRETDQVLWQTYSRLTQTDWKRSEKAKIRNRAGPRVGIISADGERGTGRESLSKEQGGGGRRRERERGRERGIEHVLVQEKTSSPSGGKRGECKSPLLTLDWIGHSWTWTGMQHVRPSMWASMLRTGWRCTTNSQAWARPRRQATKRDGKDKGALKNAWAEAKEAVYYNDKSKKLIEERDGVRQQLCQNLLVSPLMAPEEASKRLATARRMSQLRHMLTRQFRQMLTRTTCLKCHLEWVPGEANMRPALLNSFLDLSCREVLDHGRRRDMWRNLLCFHAGWALRRALVRRRAASRSKAQSEALGKELAAADALKRSRPSKSRCSRRSAAMWEAAWCTLLLLLDDGMSIAAVAVTVRRGMWWEASAQRPCA